MEVPVETALSMYDFRAEDVVANIAPRPLLLSAHRRRRRHADGAVDPHVREGRPADRTGADHGHLAFPAAPQDAPRTKAIVKGWLDKFLPTPLEPGMGNARTRPPSLLRQTSSASPLTFSRPAVSPAEQAEQTADDSGLGQSARRRFAWRAAHSPLRRDGGAGLINPKARPRQVSRKGAIAVLEADRAPGAVRMTPRRGTAMQLADNPWRRLVRRRATSPMPARRLLRAAGGPKGSRRHRHDGVRAADDLSWLQNGTGVSTNPIAIAVPGSNLDASVAARHVDRRRWRSAR